MPTTPDFFTVTCDGIGTIGIDYVDVGLEPDEHVLYAFVWIRPRLEPGYTLWAPGLTPPRGLILDDMQARFSPEDGKLRSIVGQPTNEKQRVTVTGSPTGGTFTLTYSGQTTAAIAYNASVATVQAALEALSNIAVGDIFVSGGLINEKQTITVNGAPTGGTFAVTFGSDTSDPILWNATASQVKAALQAMPSIGGIGCSVTGPSGGPWIVEFTGTLAGQNVAQMTAGPKGETQTITLHNPDGGDFSLAFMGQPTGTIAYTASAATIQTALVALSNIAPGDVTVTGPNGGPWTFAFAGAYANTDVPQLLVVQRNHVQQIIISGLPTSGNFRLTFDGLQTSPIPYNASATVVRQALEALSNIGLGNVFVSGNPGGPYTTTFVNGLANRFWPTFTVSHTFGGGTTPSLSASTITAGIGLYATLFANLGALFSVATVEKYAALSGGTIPSVTVTTTQAGSTGSPYTISFIGALAGTDVPAITATPSLTGGTTPGVTIETLTPGTGELGVKLVADTALIDYTGTLIYDIDFDVPDSDRVVKPFAIAAPTTTGQTVDLATVAKLPHRSELGIFA